MTFTESLALYYALIAAPFLLVVLVVIGYLAVEKFGCDVPRWGDE